MNIAIDVMGILGSMGRNRGIGYYTIAQIKALLALDKQNNIYLLNLYDDTSLKDILQYSDNVSEYYFNTGKNYFLWKYPELISEIYRRFIREYKIDLIYFTSPADPCHPLDKSWFKNTKYIVTVYDIIPCVLPDTDTKSIDKKQYNKALELIVNADGILAISQSVKNDLIHHLHAKAEKIQVIYAGADSNRFRVISYSQDDKIKIKEKYGILNDFILCVGGEYERKNLAYLIKAYSRLSKELQFKYQLVIVCNLQKSNEEKYYAVAKENNVADRIVFTNFVPDEDLTKLYNMAYVFAFISRYEGFGLPVLESMMCGVPVLTSNNSSLGEIAKDAAILVDPLDIADISRGLNDILQSADLNALRKTGLARAERFSWEKTAKLTLETISGITPHLQQILQQSSNELERGKIAFFTPLPPVKSGISDYSVDIIWQLAKYYSIDVFIDVGYTHNCLLPQNVSVYKHTQFHKRHSKYDRMIFQMGNNPFHKYMFKYIRKYHGVVVLHDCNLHDLLSAITYGKMKVRSYEKMLSFDYKDKVSDVIEALHDGKPKSDFIVNGFVTNFADIVIVHSKWAQKQILLKNIEANVKHINLYAQIPNYSYTESNDVKQSARKKLKISEQDIVIAAFGFLQESKRSMPSLFAIRRVINEFPQIKMIYVGEIAAELNDIFFSYIKQNNLQNSVSVTGFTSLETFLLYMDAADICLNLRFPYHGETSAALARILAVGKCVIINDIGSFSEIPDDCCVKLPSPENMLLEEEEETIYNALKELINNSKKRIELGIAAREYAEKELDLNKICRQYLTVLSSQPKQKTLTNNILSQIKIHIDDSKEENIFTLTRTLAYTMQDQDTLNNGK